MSGGWAMALGMIGSAVQMGCVEMTLAASCGCHTGRFCTVAHHVNACLCVRCATGDNPSGCHVTMEHEGRTLLGTVKGFRLAEQGSIMILHVHHFNGDAWPLSPRAWEVKLIPRTF